VRTGVAEHARKAVLEHAACQRLVGHFAHDGAPVAIRRGEPLLGRGVKRAKVIADRLGRWLSPTEWRSFLTFPLS
jgi:hypothetical protein